MARGDAIPRQLLEYREDDLHALAHLVSAVEQHCGYAGPLPASKHRRSGAQRRKLAAERDSLAKASR